MTHVVLTLFVVGAAAHVAVTAAQSESRLAALTVPAGHLPAGCGLKPDEPRQAINSQRGVVAVAGVASQNPWISQTQGRAAWIRRLVDGVPPVPDGPPMMPKEAAAFAAKFGENVVEAYLASYRRSDGSLIDVAAIRFNDAKLATPEPPPVTRLSRRGVARRIVVGPTVVRISAYATSDCFDAIEKHMRSLR